MSLALPVGAGLIGPRVDYFLQIRGTLYRIVVSAAAGGPLCVDRHCHLSAVFGLMGSWGHKHRVWVELNVATHSGVGLRFYGSTHRRTDRDLIFAVTTDEGARTWIARELDWGPASESDPESEARFSFVP